MTSDLAKRRFREVVAPHLDDAYAFAKSLSGSGADAEDIVQEAAMRALDALESQAVVNPRAWWMRVTRNAALTWIAKNRPKAISSVGDLADLAEFEGFLAGEPRETAETRMISAQTAEAVRRALADLPSPLRETLAMREINDLSYREIAAATDAPIGTVMSRLARARAALARALEGWT